MFIGHEDIASDPNWVVETLYRTLKKLEEDGPLPETLYLQLDNCFRENKNTYLMAYLSWLIERGAFKNIFVSFLPTGPRTHTHTRARTHTHTHRTYSLRL